MALRVFLATAAGFAQASEKKPLPNTPQTRRETAAEAVETRGFTVEYDAGLNERHPTLPPQQTLQDIRVSLGRNPDVYFPRAESESDSALDSFTIGDTSQARKFSPAALGEIFQAVVKHFNDQCIYGVYVSIPPGQLNLSRGRLIDLRKAHEPLMLRVSIAEAGSVKTTRIQIPYGRADTAAVDKPKDDWIAERSPVTPGSLLKKEALQTYLDRLNRFPGRRVDTALSMPEGESNGFELHYLIREERPIFVHYEASNTGAGESPKWRSQLGVEYRHPTGTDDVLRLGYSTNDFQSSNSANASYGYTLAAPDCFKGRVYGSYSQSTSKDLGQRLGTFDSKQGSLGTQLSWTPRYWKGWPIDLTLGAYWMNAAVDNRPALITGEENFLVPYIGVATERSKELYTLAMNTQIERNLPRIAGTSAQGLTALGRTDTDAAFSILRWNVQGSLWLDPLIYGNEWGARTDWRKCLKSMEFAGSFRGQAALNNTRLVPQMEAVVGGMESVRGYPEATTAADSALLAGVEYRFHLARRLLKPDSLKNPEKLGVPPVGELGSANEPAGIAAPRGFAARPARVGEAPDWDVILRTFIDGAKTRNARPVAALEGGKTLLGAGFGIELLTYRPTYFSVRADIGFALKDDTRFTSHPVHSGDARLHLGATLAW
jgi:hemolysin activation/secretion protein